MKENNINLIFKQLLAKLPVFLFCVIFIQLHNYLFGSANSVIGVAILVGLFMVLGNDLGFKTKEAVITIPILYLLVAFAPKLASFNNFLGLFINFISIFLIMAISSFNIKSENHLSFMMGYLFCQGYNLSGALYKKRVLSFLVGGILIAVIYYIVHNKKSYDKDILAVFKSINLKSEATQWHLKLSASMALVTYLGALIKYPRTMWINLAIFSLLTVSHDEHLERRKYRVPATILGCLVFWLLFMVLIPVKYQSSFILLAGFLSMFITSYFIKTIYNSFSALVTAVLLFPVSEAISIRLLSNILGVLLAIIFNNFFNKLFNFIHNKDMEYSL